MQRLAINLATTFLDDAKGLTGGLGRAVLRLATAPIERIANACDIACILSKRSAAQQSGTGTA